MIQFSSLSPREREVYELICDGLSNGEIAAAALHHRRDSQGSRPTCVRQAWSPVADCVGDQRRPRSQATARSDRRQAAPRIRLSGAAESGATTSSGSKIASSILGVVRLEVRSLGGPVFLGWLSKDRLECRDRGGVELALDRLSQPETRNAARHGIPIGSVGRHRVVRVSDRDDLGQQGNLVCQRACRDSPRRRCARDDVARRAATSA